MKLVDSRRTIAMAIALLCTAATSPLVAANYSGGAYGLRNNGFEIRTEHNWNKPTIGSSQQALRARLHSLGYDYHTKGTMTTPGYACTGWGNGGDRWLTRAVWGHASGAAAKRAIRTFMQAKGTAQWGTSKAGKNN